jgi:hypothetical protein
VDVVQTPTPPPPPTLPRLPAEVRARLLADSDVIAGRLARRLVAELELPPEFRRYSAVRALFAASRDGVRTLLHELNSGRRPHPAELAALGIAGARQAELGVPLEILLQGYRLAAKVVWREVVDRVTRLADLPPATVVVLSEQVLEYLDDISAVVGQAYLETRERMLRQHDRDRDRVLRRLVAGDVSDDLRRVAASCDLEFTPPYRVLAVAADPTLDADRLVGAAWGALQLRGPAAHLVADEPALWIAVVPAGADLAALVTAAAGALPGVRIGAGPVAHTLEDVAPAAQRARRALRVGQRLNPEAILHDDREVGVFASLAVDPEALRGYVEHVLNPLLQPGGRRRELLETLATALESPGMGEAAKRLGVHRHTVVYRLERIAATLNVDLDDPAARHRIWLALQGLRLLGE